MIRINLLAEEQAALEMKRRDPVKRAIWVCAFVVCLVLVWILSLQAKIMQAKSALETAQTQWQRMEKQDSLIKTNLTASAEMERKLKALNQLATNRFTWTKVLNALQFSMVDNIQVTEVNMDQSYYLAPPKKDAEGKKIIAPATSTERISMVIKGDDFAADSEGNHTRFMEAIARNPYFQQNLKKPDPFKAVERSRSASTQAGSRKTGTFSFQCQFPEKVR